MQTLVKNYLIDYWVWWYWFNLKRVSQEFIKDWNFTIGYLNLLPMARNIFRPMFQDNSWEGRLVAIPFRIVWVLMSTLIVAIYSVILLSAFLVYLVLPITPVIALIWGLTI